jgi:hypothetical protein
MHWIFSRKCDACGLTALALIRDLVHQSLILSRCSLLAGTASRTVDLISLKMDDMHIAREPVAVEECSALGPADLELHCSDGMVQVSDPSTCLLSFCWLHFRAGTLFLQTSLHIADM